MWVWATYVFTMSDNLLRQFKNRRIALGLKQGDMRLRVGMSRQQYQRLESKGNPRLETLELLAMGLSSELMLIPKEKLAEVMAVLEGAVSAASKQESESLAQDPWQGLLGDDDSE